MAVFFFDQINGRESASADFFNRLKTVMETLLIQLEVQFFDPGMHFLGNA
jgi:hypothetical protein